MNALWIIIGTAFGFFIAWFVRPYTSGYSSEKGKNAAVEEDSAKLTEISQQVIAKISNEAWDRQKQWELKRDTLLGAFKTVRQAVDCVLNLANHTQMSAHDKQNPAWETGFAKAQETWIQVQSKLLDELLLLTVVADVDCCRAMEDFRAYTSSVALDLTIQKPDAWRKAEREFNNRHYVVADIIRAELGFAPLKPPKTFPD